MRIKSRRLLATAIAGLLTGSTTGALATNGSFMIGSGAGSNGMGGVGVTSPQDAMCVNGNPACLSEFIQPQMDMGAAFFRPIRGGATTVMAGTPLDANGNATYQESEVNLYLLPSMGFVWPFNDNLSVGIAALPAGGGGVTFKPNFFGTGYNYLGTDLVQLIIPITAAWKFDETHTIGASIVPARQRFLAQGLDAFKPFSSQPDNLTNQGHDYANGLGARFGWAGHFMDNSLTLGATYATKVIMQKFDKYSGLFAESGSFDIPANYAIGVGYKPLENLTLALDIERIMYSDVPAFNNAGPDANGLNIDSVTNGVPGATSLGMPQGAGFGWTNQTIYKLGVAWKASDSWTLRVGYNYGKTPINKDQLLFSMVAPVTTEKHYTAGFTYNLGEQSILGFGSEGGLTFSWMYAPNTQIQGPTTGAGAGVDGQGHGMAGMYMSQVAAEIAYTLKF